MQTFALMMDRRVWIMLLLGFSAGLPILLIFGTLSVWLREADVARSTVTYFGWATLGYSFKFVWAPLIDQLRLPYLTRRLGKRRAWLLVSQFAVMGAMWLMASTDPTSGEGAIASLALGAVLLGFSSATQDIVIDAFRIESANPRMQALLSSTYIAGYRIAMIAAGAGALYLAEFLGSMQDAYQYSAWQTTYRMMSLAMLVGVVTTLSIREPERSVEARSGLRDNLQLVALFAGCVAVFIGSYVLTQQPAGALKSWLTDVSANRHVAGVLVEACRLGFAVGLALIAARLLIRARLVPEQTLRQSYVEPVSEFFARYGGTSAWLILGLIGLYRISDIVLGFISNVFYYDLGFLKSEIATISKMFGLMMTIIGGFAGGFLAFRFGVMRILMLGAILSALTNVLFMLLADAGRNLPMLYAVIGADNLSAGLASAAFVAFLSALTNLRFTAMQYAIFTSLMTLLPKMLGGYSGTMVDAIGYQNFFLFTALIGVPVLVLIALSSKRFDIGKPPPLAP